MSHNDRIKPIVVVKVYLTLCSERSAHRQTERSCAVQKKAEQELQLQRQDFAGFGLLADTVAFPRISGHS